MATGRIFTVAGAAEYLGCQPETIRVAARQGAFPNAFRDMLATGGPWRFPQADLDAYRASKHKGVKAQ